MPIEIKELHIKVTVNTPAGETQAPAGTERTEAARPAKADRQAIVAECVEQVMQIIQEKQHR